MIRKNFTVRITTCEDKNIFSLKLHLRIEMHRKKPLHVKSLKLHRSKIRLCSNNKIVSIQVFELQKQLTSCQFFVSARFAAAY